MSSKKETGDSAVPEQKAEAPEQEEESTEQVDFPFPAGVESTIHPNLVRWNMHWSRYKSSNNSQHLRDRPDVEPQFEEEMAVAMLLLNEVVHMNNHWWQDDWPPEARKATGLYVNCNDVFAWGCSDSEEMSYSEIEEVYGWWEKNPKWGPAAWCCVKRREMPQGPVERAMRDSGLDMDALREEHHLRANHYDGVSRARAQYQYELYALWDRQMGRTPVAFECTNEVNWWDHWRRYVAAHPDWSKNHESILQVALDDWREANGYERRRPRASTEEISPPVETPEEPA